MKLLVIAILLIAASFVSCTEEMPITASGKAVQLRSDFRGQYEPAVIRMKLGSTVRIEGDPNTLVDTMDTIIVDGYDVRKKIAPGDNVLEFVADKPGEFSMHCENGMGNGKLIVEG